MYVSSVVMDHDDIGNQASFQPSFSFLDPCPDPSGTLDLVLSFFPVTR